MEATPLLGQGQVLHSCLLLRVLVSTLTGAAGRVQALSERDRGGHRAGSTWPWEPCRTLQATPPSRSQLALVSSLEKVSTPESSREPVGCGKPLMEADVYKQQPGSWSRGPRDPEACPGGDGSRTPAQVWTLLGKRRRLVPGWDGAPSGPSAGCRAPLLCQLFSTSREGTNLWLGSQHPWLLAHALQERAM